MALDVGIVMVLVVVAGVVVVDVVGVVVVVGVVSVAALAALVNGMTLVFEIVLIGVDVAVLFVIDLEVGLLPVVHVLVVVVV